MRRRFYSDVDGDNESVTTREEDEEEDEDFEDVGPGEMSFFSKIPKRYVDVFGSPGFASFKMVMEILQTPDKEVEVKRLEKYADLADEAMGDIVDAYYEGFNKSITSYSKIIAQVSRSQEIVVTLKDNLQKAKRLLSTRNQELTRMWQRHLEFIAVLEFLDRIKWLQSLVVEVPDNQKAGRFVEAATSLKQAFEELEGPFLNKVGALSELTGQLQQCREQLISCMFDVLTKFVYETRTQSIFRLSLAVSTPNSEAKTAYVYNRDHSSSSDTNKSVIQALQLLGATSKTVSQLQKDIRPSLNRLFVELDLVTSEKDGPRTSTRLTLSRLTAETPRTPVQSLAPAPLSERIKQAFDRCTEILDAFAILCSLFSEEVDGDRLMLSSVWHVMESTIEDMLRVQLYDLSELAKKSSALSTDLQTSKRLFSFAGSAVYMHDAALRCSSASGPEVSKGNPRHIVLAFPHILRIDHFVQELFERHKSAMPKSLLRAFATRFVTGEYFPYIRSHARSSLRSIIEASDAFKPQDPLRCVAYDSSYPIFDSVHSLLDLIQELIFDLYALPPHARDLLELCEELLLRYCEKCEDHYASVVGHGGDSTLSETGRLLHGNGSTEYIAMLRSDPLFAMASSGGSNSGGGGGGSRAGGRVFRGASRSDIGELETCSNPDSIASSASSLGFHVLETTLEAPLCFRDLSRDLLVFDEGKLLLLAGLTNTLHSLSGKLSELSSNRYVTDSQRSGACKSSSRLSKCPSLHRIVAGVKKQEALTDPLSPELAAHLTTRLQFLSHRFHSLSLFSLFALRTELRLHCFFFIRPLATTSFDIDPHDTKPNSCVVDLNHDLQRSEELVSTWLPHHKQRFVFDGLARLISNILIRTLAEIPSINEIGVVKMSRNIFALQQNLAVTVFRKEHHFDRARRFYDLLTLKDDNQLLAHISQQLRINAKPPYTLQEYRLVLEHFIPTSKSSRSSVLQELQSLFKESSSV